MATQYHIYANDGLGGVVDYTTVVATTAALSYAVGPLDFGSDWTFALRAFDTVSGLEEKNADARRRIRVGGTGVDLAGLPNPPSLLRALPRAAGTATVSWAYSTRGQGAAPTGFRVYKGTPSVSYTSPVTVLYSRSATHFSATLSGLAGGSVYQVAVRAYNASGEEANATVAVMTAATAGPGAATNLAATPIS